jgi:hypothetical protein
MSSTTASPDTTVPSVHMLYNSETFTVLQFQVAVPLLDTRLMRGGYEIVDKFARREIFLEGALAEKFKRGVQDLIETSPSQDDFDDFVESFAVMAQQSVMLH